MNHCGCRSTPAPICCPTVCATPSTMPPRACPTASRGRRSPRPRTRRSAASGREYGSNDERMPRNAPASAAVATRDRGRARVDGTRVDRRPARRCRGPAAVARSMRPSACARRNSCSPPSSDDGDGEDEHVELGDRDLARDRPAVVAERAEVGAERAHVGAEDLEQEVLDHDRQARTWSAAASARRSAGCARARPLQQRSRAPPCRRARGRARARRRDAVIGARTQTRNAPSTARSPCARLMIRITPNISDSPHASSA